jgi:hypothetical protein
LQSTLIERLEMVSLPNSMCLLEASHRFPRGPRGKAIRGSLKAGMVRRGASRGGRLLLVINYRLMSAPTADSRGIGKANVLCLRKIFDWLVLLRRKARLLRRYCFNRVRLGRFKHLKSIKLYNLLLLEFLNSSRVWLLQ